MGLRLRFVIDRNPDTIDFAINRTEGVMIAPAFDAGTISGPKLVLPYPFILVQALFYQASSHQLCQSHFLYRQSSLTVMFGG